MTATRARIAEWANMIGRTSRRPGAPPLDAGSSRERVLAWLQWNDRNGCYLDALAIAEDLDPVTLDEAWDMIEHEAEDNAWD